MFSGIITPQTHLVTEFELWEPSDLVRSGVTCELLKLGGADLHAVQPTYLMLHDTKGHSAHQPPSIHCQSRDTTIVSL